METITIASQKGGVGKSTITIHLAVSAAINDKSVLIADLDPFSRTSTHWASLRDTDKPTVIEASADDVKDLKEQAKKEGFDFLFFDCPPFVSDAVIEASGISDFTLVPMAPTFPEVQSLIDVIDKVKEPYAVILNNCQASHTTGFDHVKTKEVRELIEAEKISVYPGSIVRRVAYQDALNGGQAVIEYDKNSKASIEMNKLYNWIMEKI